MTKLRFFTYCALGGAAYVLAALAALTLAGCV